jgi:SAM-dependent methyltransferase
MSTESPDRFWTIFFEVYEELPRQGPGRQADTARALSLCSELGESPLILDLGCGSGKQTLDLAELTGATIIAIDNHEPFIELLSQTVARRGLANRVRPIVGDMASPPCSEGSVDLIWSEGAAYFLGIANALGTWRPLLRPGGYIAFTECVWLDPSPPREVREIWAKEYPAMTDIEGTLEIIARSGLELVGHFTLPDAAWWDDFYTPMSREIRSLRRHYDEDEEAQAILDALEAEIDMHRNFGHTYGYEFFVLRSPL